MEKEEGLSGRRERHSTTARAQAIASHRQMAVLEHGSPGHTEAQRPLCWR